MSYNTNVIKNDKLFELAEKADKFKKRDCFLLLQHFFSESYDGKVLIIYGLPKTGKTTLMLQKIKMLPKERVVYIKIAEADNMKMLCKDLDKLKNEGYKYIFIDEITIMDDFVSQAALLSDIYACMGMKITISGNDSLCFCLARREELYDRCSVIHTTYSFYKEYARLFNDKSINNYLEHGGKLESADTPYENSVFYDSASMKNYIDKSICSNIINAYEKSGQHDYFRYFIDDYNKGNLLEILNDFIWKFIYNYVIVSIKTYYDFKNSTIKEKEIIKKVNDKFEMVAADKEGLINFEQYDMILKYLQDLDLLEYYSEYYEKYSQGEIQIYTYPAMINVVSKEYIHDILLDKYFDTASIDEEKRITDKIYNAVKMRIYTDTIFLDMDNSIKYNEEVFRYNFYEHLEHYFVHYDYGDNVYRIYEIRYDDKLINKKTSALFDKEKFTYINKKYGKIAGRYVIYLGESKTVDGVEYKNVEDFLLSIGYQYK